MYEVVGLKKKKKKKERIIRIIKYNGEAVRNTWRGSEDSKKVVVALYYYYI